MEHAATSGLLLADMSPFAVTFSEATTNCYLPLCSMTQECTCVIFNYLSTINRLLFTVKLELREMTGRFGQLYLMGLEEEGMYSSVCPDMELRQAAQLMRWLLKSHACIQHIFIHPFVWHSHGALLCDGLNRNPSIKTMKVGIFEFTSTDLHAVIGSLRNLEEFECVTYIRTCRHFAPTVVTLLRLSTLRTLNVSKACLNDSRARLFVDALKENATLRQLGIHSSVIYHAGQGNFSEYLMTTKSLMTLSVESGHRNRRKCFRWMAAGLIVNNTIQNLSFYGIALDAGTAQLVARMLTENKVIRNFTIVCDHAELVVPPGTDLACLHTALTKNDTLERLELPFSFLEPAQWVQFFWTVSSKQFFQRLTVHMPNYCYTYRYLPRFCKALKESGAETKVSLGTLENVFDLELLESKSFSDVNFSCPDGSQGQQLALLQLSLPMKSLGLYVNSSDAELCSAIAKYIRKVSLLETLRLRCSFNDPDFMDTTRRAWREIFESLAASTSLKKLRLDFVHGMWVRNPVYEREVELLADVINASQSIRRVSFNSHVTMINRGFFRRLCFGIAENYILVSIDTWPYLDKRVTQESFAVWDTVRRNASFVTLAADFTDGRTLDRRCVRALERVLRHPPLLEELAEQESLNVAEASAMVRRKFSRAEGLHDFMRLAGVVKERVECNSRAGGRLQLDDLDEYCWRKVRSYLMIDDIKDPGATTPVYR
ncbi:uncharacterized protein LOC125945883 [Dermacentor silvarum]|uniref:uncharacterized protein LOC125945883 n=1 Tax=Dermacentor silvarum TaxID=543639 RepID=UPI002100B384|nr:uncharacterized protein LOC125945883 [Dermacentor silvarum]